ncbi:MAG: AAA family ATPase [Actinobacteria bacterium]|nr:AAA family ATPase [Actinomycetota bacterium]MCG2818779.1 AAA family ATPase [Actinomycetes bacterium]MBU4217714.1 AAA family ATPase [Actinomycetota bacterium]MBU4358973.1 AAA family ATPase [Actinomycetota bacterium]MBU4391686.1 AAA family ATPase [Actinomycetota bacterium]
MIEKFISIKNIGRFRDCCPKGDVAFRNLTLLFAENGRGKTMLCAILRSLQTGQPEFISERKTLGTNEAASVQMRLGNSTLTFSNNAWSAIHPDIAIFDSVFIHDNVYAGDYVDHEQKKNLYRVIVGTQGVQLAKQIEELDGKIRDANADIRTKKEAVSRTLPNRVTLESYLAWQPVDGIESRIQQKNTEIANRQLALDKATEIQSKALLAKISLPTFPEDFLTILGKKLTDITADAETCVRQQIASHQMGNQGETWLSQGMGYVRNDLCPFCGQGIQFNDLSAAYRSHFNTAYKTLKEEVARLSQRITIAIGDTALNAVQQALSGNLALIEFWKQFTEVSVPDFPFQNVQANCARLRGLALALAQRKQQNPVEAVTPNDHFTTALNEVQSLQQAVDTYNAAVAASNARITEQKTAVQQGGDINSLKQELADLEAKKKRFEPDMVQACQDYQDALIDKNDLEQQKDTAKQQLDQRQSILQTYEHAINEYLDQFNTGFRIVNTQHSYRGGTPSSQFQIQINNTSVDLGDSRTPAGTPCFKTTLSSGDRSALALAFFLAALKQDANLGNKIVVLDDPFTSLDRFRRTCTQQLIRGLSCSAQQVIVLSHDPHFLKLVSDGHSSSEMRTLQLFRTGNNTKLGEWDIEEETLSTYQKDYSTLLNFYRDRSGTSLDVARAIRPFLEGMLRVHFPGYFQPNEWLGDFISKIRGADSASGLQHAKDDLLEFEAINEYSKKYHHEQNPNADSEPIFSDELHGFVKRTLRLVGGD